MAQQQSTPVPPAQAYLPAYVATPINGGGNDNEEKEIVKLKITSKSISASGADCDDVAQMVFKENAVIATQLLYVNDDQVVVNSPNFFLDSNGNVIAPKAKIDNLNANGLTVNTSVKADSMAASTITVDSLKVAGAEPLLRSKDLDFDPNTGTLTVKNLKVVSDIQVLPP
jgi:hypothetical protein